MSAWLDLLPCTSVELAIELNITVRLANARLQNAKRDGKVRRTDRQIRPLDTQPGWWPYIWERTTHGVRINEFVRQTNVDTAPLKK